MKKKTNPIIVLVVIVALIFEFLNVILMTPLMPIIVIMLLSGDNKEQKAENQQILASAKANAVVYVQEKYGFTASVENAVQERKYGMFNSTPQRFALVDMSYDGQSFHVYISADDAENGCDDYQFPQLKKAFCDMLEAYAPGCMNITLSGGEAQMVAYDPIEDKCEHLFRTYFDGSNLAEVISISPCNIVMDYVNGDFSGYADWQLPTELVESERFHLWMVSYRSEEAWQRMRTNTTYDEHRSVYIEETLHIGLKKRSFESYSMREFHGICVTAKESCLDSVQITTMEEDTDNLWDGHILNNRKIITDTYLLQSGDEGQVLCFFPTAKLVGYKDKDSAENYQLLICMDDGTEKIYEKQWIRFVIIGDYIYFTLDPADLETKERCYFTFVQMD